MSEFKAGLLHSDRELYQKNVLTFLRKVMVASSSDEVLLRLKDATKDRALQFGMRQGEHKLKREQKRESRRQEAVACTRVLAPAKC